MYYWLGLEQLDTLVHGKHSVSVQNVIHIFHVTRLAKRSAAHPPSGWANEAKEKSRRSISARRIDARPDSGIGGP